MRVEHQDSFVKYHRLTRLAYASVATFIVISGFYFAYRIPLMNPDTPVLSGVLLFAEAFGMLSLGLHLLGTWCLVERKAPPPEEGVTADILITTWNEPVELLRNTLLAARNVRLVNDIWLLDDGNRREMKALAEELGVKYLARVDRSNAKAGNLNNALKHTKADYVAIFDCDHAPAPEFFERTLGYFRDPKVAFVQSPQDFFNVDSFQHRKSEDIKEYWHEQTLFYRVIQPGKDYWNAAFFCGSCAVARRTALEDIGGIATGTITEDIHTSLRLHKKGWKSIYHSEALAFGLSPASHDQYDTQRLRWGRGAMQVWRKEGILFRGKLTLAQRLCYLASTVTYFEGWQKAVVYLMPMVVLLTGALPIVWTGMPFILLFVAWILSGMLVNETVGRGYTKTFWMEEYNFLRFYTFINATLALVIPKSWRFKVTPKESVAHIQIPVRLLPQALVVAGAFFAIAAGSVLYLFAHHIPFSAYAANVIWLSVNAAIAFRALHFVSKRLHQRRASHRFPIPVPLSLNLKSEARVNRRMFVADDVSSTGMRVECSVSDDIPDKITGLLHLPGTRLPFEGDVVRRSKKGTVQTLQVRFDWKTSAEADPLNACLYGNSLQWDLNNWIEADERDFNPLDLLAFRNREETEPDDFDKWRFAYFMIEGEKSVPCLLRRIDGAFKGLMAVSYAPPGSVEKVDIQVNDVQRPLKELYVTGSQFYSVGKGVVYLTTFDRENLKGSVKFHRDPAWMRSAGDAA